MRLGTPSDEGIESEERVIRRVLMKACQIGLAEMQHLYKVATNDFKGAVELM
jgi:hypothetical protein